MNTEWRSCKGIERNFVRYRSKDDSAAFVWHKKNTDSPSLSVIIPTKDAYRKGYFPRLLAQTDRQTFPDSEQIVIRGDSRQGRAINTGVSLANGKYILILDDDTSLPDPETFQKLVTLMDSHPDIGMAGGNNVIPDHAGFFVRKAMQQIPRRSWMPVQEITDSDLAEHPCLIMRTEEFKSIGGENELIPRGLDPWLREQYRRTGKRVVVVPEVIYHHLPPDNPAGLLRQFCRNGKQAAWVNRNYPQWVFETPAGHGDFKSRVPFRYRMLRFPFRLMGALLKGQFLFFGGEMAYAFGFIWEYLSGRNTSEIRDSR